MEQPENYFEDIVEIKKLINLQQRIEHSTQFTTPFKKRLIETAEIKPDNEIPIEIDEDISKCDPIVQMLLNMTNNNCNNDDVEGNESDDSSNFKSKWLIGSKEPKAPRIGKSFQADIP